MRRALWLYGWVVRCYPPDYRRMFGAQMMQTFADFYADMVSQGQAGAGFWFDILIDDLAGILREQVSAVRTHMERDMSKTSRWIFGLFVGGALALTAFTLVTQMVAGLSVLLAVLIGLVCAAVLALAWAARRWPERARYPRWLAGIVGEWRLAAGVLAAGTLLIAVSAIITVMELSGSMCSSAPAAHPPLVSPVTAQDFLNDGDLAFGRGACDEAIADYSRAIQLDPTIAEAYNNRAYVYMAEQQFALALPDLDRAIALRPDYVNALMNRADIHNFYYAIDRQSAIADYDRIIQLGAGEAAGSVCGHRYQAQIHAGDHQIHGGLDFALLGVPTDPGIRECQREIGRPLP